MAAIARLGRQALAVALAVCMTHMPTAQGCTMIAAGRNATSDGSIFMAHNNDAGGGAADLRLVRVPAQDWEENAKRPVYNFFSGYPRIVSKDRGPMYAPADDKQRVTLPLGYIPQVRHTYAYWDQDYGMMNEKQLSIAESTCGARTVGWATDVPYGKNLFGIAELSKVALERCDSARCAVQTMGDLAVEYGFYSEDSGDPNDPGYDDSAETLAIGDKYGEIWVFHVATGKNNASAVWAAQRVPEDHVTVVANGFTIRQMNLTDRDWFLASPNIEQVAKEMGFWDPAQGPFDFSAAFGYQTLEPRLPLYVGRRVWRVFDLVAPSLKLDSRLGSFAQFPTYPFSVRPDKPVTLEKMMSMMRDYYQGTQYDLSQGVGAGPFNAPVRWDGHYKIHGGWERPISIFRTMYSMIMQVRSNYRDSVGGVLWYAQSTPHSSVYVPFSCAQSAPPDSYLEGEESQFSTSSAWWAFDFLKNWAMLRYNAMSKPILHEIDYLEGEAATMRKEVEEHTANMTDDEEIVAYLEQQSNDFADKAVKHWWNLAWKMVGMFSDGYSTTGEQPEDMVKLGYPVWWLNMTEFASWPGDSFAPPIPANIRVQLRVATPKPNPIVVNAKPEAQEVEAPRASISHPDAIGWSHVAAGVMLGMLVGAGGMLAFHRTRRMGYRPI